MYAYVQTQQSHLLKDR